MRCERKNAPRHRGGLTASLGAKHPSTWGKTPIAVPLSAPRTCHRQPAKQLTPPAEKRATGGAWVAACAAASQQRRSSCALVVPRRRSSSPPLSALARPRPAPRNLQVVSTSPSTTRSRPLPLRRGQLRHQRAVPAGGGCGRRPCWSEAPTGLAHNNGDGSTTGTVALTLKKG